MADVATIPIGIDLGDFLRQIQDIPGLTAKSAEKIAANFAKASVAVSKEATKQANEAEKAARRAADAAAKEADRAAREINGSMSEQIGAIKGLSGAVFGGIAGDIFDMMDVASGASKGLAGIGIALAGVAVGGAAISAIVSSIKGMADAAREALPDLMALASTEATNSLQSYGSAVDDASAAFGLIKVEIGSLIAEAVTPLLENFVLLTPSILGVIEQMRAFVPTVQAIARVMFELHVIVAGFPIAMAKFVATWTQFADATDAVVQGIRTTASEFEEFGPTLENAGLTIDDVNLSLVSFAKNVDGTAEPLKKTGDNVRKITDEMEDARAEVQAFQNSMVLGASKAEKVVSTAYSPPPTHDWVAFAGGTEEALREVQTQIEMFERNTLAEKLQGVSVVFGYMASSAIDAASAINGALLGSISQLQGQLQQMAREEYYRLESQTDAVKDRYQAEIEAAQAAASKTLAAEKSKNSKLSGAAKEAADDQFAIFEEQTQAQLDAEMAAIKARKAASLAAIEEKQRAEKKAAKQAFEVGQGLARASAIIDAAAAAVALIPAFAILGPGAPVAAAAVAGAGLRVQLEVIKNTPPPKFAFGGVVGGGPLHAGGDVPALLERGEGVVSNRGMSTPGAADIVAALNSGLSMPRVQEVYIDGIAQGARTNHRRPGSGKVALKTRYT